MITMGIKEREMNQLLFKIYMIAMLITALVPNGVSAQFQGDVFFDQPSVAIEEGSEGSISISAFAGALPVGAAHLRVDYDPGQIEIIDVSPANAPEFQNGLTSKIEDGTLSFITLNDTSLSDPFGTVSLATILIRAKASAGTIAPLGLAVQSLLDTNSINFPASRGFSGEIVITSATSSARVALLRQASSASSTTANMESLMNRALNLRRPGSTVPLMVYDSEMKASTMMVKTPADSSKPSDEQIEDKDISHGNIDIYAHGSGDYAQSAPEHDGDISLQTE